MAGFTLSSLSTYTSQIGNFFTPVVIPASLKGGNIDIVDNVKYKTALNKLYAEVYLQNTSCGINPSGYTLPSQVTLEVCQISYLDKYCFVGTTNQYWFNELMAAGSSIENNEWFNSVFLPYVGKLLVQEVEKIFWQGNTDTGTGNLALCDGIDAIISGSTTHTKTGSTTLTTANIIAQIDMMFQKLPDSIKYADVTLYVAPAVASLIPGGYAASYGQYGFPIIVTNQTTVYPLYPNMKISVQNGWQGTNHMLLTADFNLTYGTDVLDEQSNIFIHPDPITKYVYYGVDWKQGAAIKQLDLVVTNF